MKTENELSLVGWLLLIGMFAGLGYWFLQPLQPLTSLWPCVQTILKGLALIIMVIYQFMVVVEAGEMQKLEVKSFTLSRDNLAESMETFATYVIGLINREVTFATEVDGKYISDQTIDQAFDKIRNYV